MRYATSLKEDLLKQNAIDLHYDYLQLIDMYYSKRDKEGYIDKCIHVCLKDIELYPQFKQAYIKDDLARLKLLQSYRDFGSDEYNEFQQEIDTYEFPKLSVPSFKRLAIIYEQQKRYEEAIEICEKAISYELDDGTMGGFEGRIERLQKKIVNPPKKSKPLSIETVKKNELKKDASIQLANKSSAADGDGFQITFSRSTSSNFERALYLAKQSDEFSIAEYKGNEIYQAYYEPKNHLEFINLYGLVSDWKSTFVFHKGEMVDKKSLGQVNYCYGDKLRSGNDNFCYGASMFTNNPLGCHRLMIHDSQKPWYKWIRGENKTHIFIDKDGMKRQIDAKAKTFRLCPAFNYDNIISNLNQLPNSIEKGSDLYKKLYVHQPNNSITIHVNMDRTTKNKPKHKPPKQLQSTANSGCGTLVALFPLTLAALYFAKLLF